MKLDQMGDWERSSGCGEPRLGDVGREVTVMGWVATRRDHGGLLFVDLRDRTGLLQLVFNPERDSAAHERGGELRNEWVVAVRGELSRRPEETRNPSLPTGEVEVLVRELRVLNATETLPFPIDDEVDIAEVARLRHRYLDLRRPRLAENLSLRHKLSKAVRDYLDAEGFLEVETPILTRSTPEGARDYLVPSRVTPGSFFALPQSPQLFKQLLMVAGVDRYFQIARCFRDEDLRADRQPEFTQIDLELSFTSPKEIFRVVEGMLTAAFRSALGVDIETPFPRVSYDEAMARWGTDKPDLRFELEIRDFSDTFRESGFKVFRQTLERGGVVRGLVVDGGAFSRKDLDDLVAMAPDFGAKGLVWIRIQSDGWQSPVAKFLSDSEKAGATEIGGLEPGKLLFLVADAERTAATALGQLRLHLAAKLDLVDHEAWRFLWVTEFPLVEWNETDRRFYSVNHPFTAPREEDLSKLEEEPAAARADAYDVVLNGWELGGGSMRIHDADLQRRVFSILGIEEEEARARFGFLLEALSFGAPPHGGIALGFDRLAALAARVDSIRDVIAFPKTQKAACLMTEAPGAVDRRQLRELRLKVNP